MIKTAFCVSYDWKMLRNSLPRVYEASDVICLGLDKDRHTWACNPFEFDDDAFYQFVRDIDTQNKIIILEDDFSLSGLNSRENGNRHRTLMSEKMGLGGWHLQVDSDEYFLDFKGFVQHLKHINPNPTGSEKAVNVCANWIPLVKKTESGYLHVDFHNQLPEQVPIATNVPSYERARHNGHFNLITPFYVIHETWARSEDELWFKINNWGHASEELVEHTKRMSYFALWKALDQYNCQYVRDFHPASAPTWPALRYIPAKDIQELLANFKTPAFPYSARRLKLENNRNVARGKALWRKIIR